MKGLLYVSLHEDSGYGVAGRRLIRALVDLGVPVTWTPMVTGRGWGLGYQSFEGSSVASAGDLAPLCNRPLAYDTVIVHTVPEYYPLWRRRLADGARPRPLVLGHTVWETDRLPALWPDLLRRVDGLLVPSHWNTRVFAEAGLGRPIARVPHVCDEALLREAPEPGPAGREPFRFYTIGAWTSRKAQDALVRAYLRAFTARDPVELVIKTDDRDFTSPHGRLARRLRGSHHSTARALSRLTSGAAGAPPIRLDTRPLSDREIVDLHVRGDCYVSLCRSEGWGIGAFDAATLGNPVVMTGFGGQLDFLGEDSPYLVPYRLVPVDDPQGSSYTPDQTWAEPDVEQAAGLLREVFEHPARAWRHAAELSVRVRERYAPRRVASDLVSDIETLRESAGAAP